MAKIILLNKPFNVLCQFTDTEGRKTLADFVNEPKVYPAGRLDYDSEGLVILTNNGQLQHKISNPSQKLSKTYYAQVEGKATDADLKPLQQGITLKDGNCKPAQASIVEPPNLWDRTPPVRERKNIPTTWLKITISEGRNRQVRRMTAAIGFPTLRLIRIQIGEWTVDELKPGDSKQFEIHMPNKLKTRKRRVNTHNKAR